jgi:hypothetical protein
MGGLVYCPYFNRFTRTRFPQGRRTRAVPVKLLKVELLSSRNLLVGATGFEPATSWSQTKCSSQAELRSEPKAFNHR